MTQAVDQAIDVTHWQRDEEFAEYPEGARDKTLVYCPSPAPFPFLIPKHRYLFKRSSPRYHEQYWVEILAYRLAKLMNIEVAPAFVAFDRLKGQCGALIEWFLYPLSNHSEEIYIPGGDYCQQYIPDFDRKKGKQHNFLTVSQIFSDLQKKYSSFSEDWQVYWAKTFVFDALIGNTDRHQDNWGIIASQDDLNTPHVYKIRRIAPIFDNGTSMGHEIKAHKFPYFDDVKTLNRYVKKGWHHMKWQLHDDNPLPHAVFLQKLSAFYPQTHSVMFNCLKKTDEASFQQLLMHLAAFQIPIRLSAERATFMLRLLKFRHEMLLNVLET